MDISLAGSAITYRPDDDQLGSLSIEFAAFDGEVGTGQLPVPDPGAAVSVLDGRSVRIEDGSTRVTDGFIIDQDRERGPMPAGTARLHTFSIQDANALLDGFRVVRSRGSETDVARVLAFAAADGPSWDTTWVVNTETVTMPAKKYDGDGGWAELISDVVEFTGKTLWLHDLTDGSGRCLHYHNLTSGHGCGLTISDQIADLDSTTFAPIEPRRQRTSIDLRNDVLGRDQTGRTSLATDATSISQHDADGLQHQSLQVFDAVSQADLDVKTAAFLASQKDERDTYTCQIGPLDGDDLALIRVGDIMTVTSSVMGLTASPQRIAHMTLQPATGEDGRVAEGYWFAALELGAPVRRRRRFVSKPFVDEPWVCVPPDLTVYWADGPGLGFATIVDASWHNQQDGTTVSTSSGGGYLTAYAGATYEVRVTGWPLVEGGGPYPPGSAELEYGWLQFCGIASPAGFTGAGFDMGLYGSTGSGGSPIPPVYGEQSTTWTPSATRTDYYGQVHAVNDIEHNSNGWTSFFTVLYVSGPDPRFESLPACIGEPRVGQGVRYTDPLGDGTTTDFTTDWAYIPGSLHLSIGGLDWTPEIVESDPTAGTYSLLYPVPLGANTVVVEYRRAA